MRKDIQIPEVKGINLAIAQEYNEIFKTYDWYAYLINEKEIDLEMVLIVSWGYDNQKETSKMRHKIERMPAKSIAKIELMQSEVLQLDNEFMVTFFVDNQLCEKNFIVGKNTVNEENLKMIESLNKKGVVFN